MKYSSLFAGFAALIFASCASAQDSSGEDAAESEAPPTPPCMRADNDEHDDFDFWVGEWNVYDTEGNYAGHNAITKINAGCLIHEHWVGRGGFPGDSYNFYDPLAGEWRQVWVSGGFMIDYTGGLNEDGEMVLEGELASFANRQPQDFRGVWTPNEDGTVRQYFEMKDESGEWQPWFEGRYVRKSDDPNADEAQAIREEAGHG